MQVYNPGGGDIVFKRAATWCMDVRRWAREPVGQSMMNWRVRYRLMHLMLFVLWSGICLTVFI